jgi:hypothetical protein
MRGLNGPGIARRPSNRDHEKKVPNVHCCSNSGQTRCGWIVCFVPIATDAPQQIVSLFNHLVGLGEQHWQNFQAERLRGLEVDDEIV